MQQSIRKVVVAALIVGVFVFYSLTHARASSSTLAPVSSSPGAAGGTTPTSPSTTAPAGQATATSGSSTTYKDGSYTGSVADAQWGYIQVKAIISGGKITDVQFLQYPNERDRSIQINSAADPQLTSEAIQAQSAQVDIVTGATDSSQAFIQSLSDALSQAHA